MEYILFATKRYEYMKGRMRANRWDCAFGDGDIERKTFPDGEHYQRIATDVKGSHAVIVGGTVSDSDTLELYDMACAIVKYGARKLSIVIPYFGYSTMERSTKPGEIVTAKTRARLFSSIPICPEGNRVFLLDLHSEGIPHYFEGNIRPIHIYAKDITKKMILDVGGTVNGTPDFVLACTDAGRAKWVESLANDLKTTASFVFKRRVSDRETQVTAVSAQVKDRNVVIYDDMLRTGGSMCGAIRAYKEAGAKGISVVVTHGVIIDGFDKVRTELYVPPSKDWLWKSKPGVFASPAGSSRTYKPGTIATTDSHYIAGEIISANGVRLYSVGELLSEKVHTTP